MTFSGPSLPTQSTDLVTYTVRFGARPQQRSDQILSVSVHKEINKIPWARIVLMDGNAADRDFPASNDARFAPGTEVEIMAGYHSQETTIFKGIILSHSIKVRKGRPSVLTVECRDKAVALTVGRKNKYRTGNSDDEILQAILSEYGLGAPAASPAAPAAGGTPRKLIQYNASDWDFLVSRAETGGKLVFVDDGQVQLLAPQPAQAPAATYTYGADLHEVEADLEATHQYQRVQSSAWDYTQQQLATLSASPPTLPENPGDSGQELAAIIGLSTFDLYHPGMVEQTEMQSWADARFLRSRLAKIRGRAKIQGAAALKPGMVVQLDGVGRHFNGPVYVSAVHHHIGEGDWKTDIQFGLTPRPFARSDEFNELPAAGLLPAVSGLQTGVVTKLFDDPDGQHRIQVRLPIVDPQDQGTWARVASPDAGNNRGAFFRPEIGDEVVVGFVHDDPRDPVVLGMLHSQPKPAPIQPADDNNHQKGIFTRGQMKVLFDDEKLIMTLETPAGNRISLDENAGALTIQDQNGNKITLDSNGITLDSCKDLVLKAASGDIKASGVNIEHQAQAAFKAQGASGAELTSSGNAVVKGATVMIN